MKRQPSILLGRLLASGQVHAMAEFDSGGGGPTSLAAYHSVIYTTLPNVLVTGVAERTTVMGPPISSPAGTPTLNFYSDIFSGRMGGTVSR
jgi:hypothetical protein